MVCAYSFLNVTYQEFVKAHLCNRQPWHLWCKNVPTSLTPLLVCMQQENLIISKTELYTEQMHENLRTQIIFYIIQQHNNSWQNDTVLQTKRGKARGQKNELDPCYTFGKTPSVHPNFFFLLMLFTFIPLLIFIKVKTFNFILGTGAMYQLTREISILVVEKFNGTSQSDVKAQNFACF